MTSMSFSVWGETALLFLAGETLLFVIDDALFLLLKNNLIFRVYPCAEKKKQMSCVKRAKNFSPRILSTPTP